MEMYVHKFHPQIHKIPALNQKLYDLISIIPKIPLINKRNPINALQTKIKSHSIARNKVHKELTLMVLLKHKN